MEEEGRNGIVGMYKDKERELEDRKKHKLQTVIVNCHYCRKEFITTKKILSKGNGKFCSRSCVCKYSHKTKKIITRKKGIWKHSEKTRKLISISKTGIPSKSFTKFKFNHTPWNWNGGKNTFMKNIRLLSKYKKWRQNIFLRDNYTCKICNKRGGNIHPHHKKPLSTIAGEFLKSNFKLSPIKDRGKLLELAIIYMPFWDKYNGLTLCESCHKTTPSYGKGKYI